MNNDSKSIVKLSYFVLEYINSMCEQYQVNKKDVYIAIMSSCAVNIADISSVDEAKRVLSAVSIGMDEYK